MCIPILLVASKLCLDLCALFFWPCKVSPKACGHTRGRKVVSRDEAVMRIKAALDARKESGSDIVIVARTDSRQALSLDESLWRSRAFADAGADVLFIDALASREEMKAFCEISPLVPKMVGFVFLGKCQICITFQLEIFGSTSYQSLILSALLFTFV